MINVYDYTDHRKYLKDCFAFMHGRDPLFSYGRIARKAGFNNRGFAFNVFQGKKNLSPGNCARVSKVLKHGRNQAKYFKTLVDFQRAHDLGKKQRLFKKLFSIKPRGKGHSAAQLVNKDQYEYYSKWYHSAVRALIGISRFKGDWPRLANKVFPAITPGQAKKSVELLIRLGIVRVENDGTHKITSARIISGEEAKGVALRNFHYECAELARKAISTHRREDRNISGLTLGVSKEVYAKICEKIASFQKEIMDITDSTLGADRVYQLNFHFFPISRIYGDSRGKRRKPLRGIHLADHAPTSRPPAGGALMQTTFRDPLLATRPLSGGSRSRGRLKKRWKIQ